MFFQMEETPIHATNCVESQHTSELIVSEWDTTHVEA